MKMKLSRHLLTFLAASALIASPALAQSSDATHAGITRANLISANPIGLLFEWYNGELEHAITPTASLAVSGTSYDLNDSRYTSVDGIARYYPSARALHGFSVGGSIGFVSVNDNCSNCSNTNDFSAATIGVRGDYVWILGRDQRFSVETGIGAKRILSNRADVEGLPIGRLSIGYAW
jgi:hypothetical protein